MTASLRVLLNDFPVGVLRLDKEERSEFRLYESYKTAYPRPILGQIFIDNPNQVWRNRARVPPWFSNLLPEGQLRHLIAEKAGVATSREFFLLHLLGEDLPGAVRIIPDMPESDHDKFAVEEEVVAAIDNDVWHFSLAGVQLKFSAQRSEQGLTIPATGIGGDWIIKLPDARMGHVPVTEYATMRWAQSSGVEIPEIALVDIEKIRGLPSSVGELKERKAFAIRRFDRSTNGGRIHIEDFAQILGLYPERKYEKFNYETQASLVLSLAGENGLSDFIQRLVFVVASGNGDAHHKNLSLLYADGFSAELSPAYDQVSTILYRWDDKLALNLARSKRWEDVGMESFLRLARKIGDDERRMRVRVQKAVGAVLDSWDTNKHEFGFSKDAQGTIEKHFKRVPLLSHPS